MDMILHFLQCEEKLNPEKYNRKDPPTFELDTNKIDELIDASKALDIPSLQEYCLQMRKKFENGRYS